MRDYILIWDGSLRRPETVAECAFADAIAAGKMGKFGGTPKHGEALTLVDNGAERRFTVTYVGVGMRHGDGEKLHSSWFVLVLDGLKVDLNEVHRFAFGDSPSVRP